MESRAKISSHWRQPLATSEYTTGVSLHSHTSVSEETLSFIHAMGVAIPGLQSLIGYYARRAETHGLVLDFERANWRPPLQPRMAYDLESRQIQRLGLNSLVSITDHDTIEAPMLLRTVPSSRHIPVSLEWSCPFGETIFHLGIHNIPSKDGMEWMRRMEAYTAAPQDAESDNRLLAMLRELHESPQVLIVFNHPLWDLHKVGPMHVTEVRRFLKEARGCIHALELNGLRHVKENREVGRLAKETGYLPISGGDRHGLEPNANINLTTAASFTEFVEEIRVDKVSHVHFMDQYAQKWEQRIVASTLNAFQDFPDFMPGWQKWDERVFHPNKDGVMRPLAELWPGGRAPRLVTGVVKTVRMFRMKGVSAPLSLAFPGVNRMESETGTGMEWV
jgi:hypothetical protein